MASQVLFRCRWTAESCHEDLSPELTHRCRGGLVSLMYRSGQQQPLERQCGSSWVKAAVSFVYVVLFHEYKARHEHLQVIIKYKDLKEILPRTQQT